MAEPIEVKIITSSADRPASSGSVKGQTNEQRRQEAEARKAVDRERRKKEQAARELEWAQKRAANRAASAQTQNEVAAFRQRLAQTIKLENEQRREERREKRKALNASLKAEKEEADRKTTALDNAFFGVARRLGLGSVATGFANVQQAAGANSPPGGPKVPIAMNLPLPSGIKNRMGFPTPPAPTVATPPPTPPPKMVNGYAVGANSVWQPGMKNQYPIGSYSIIPPSQRGTPPTPPTPPPNKIPPMPNPPGGGNGGGSPFSAVNLAKVFFVLEIVKTLGQVASLAVSSLRSMAERLNSAVDVLAKFNGAIAGAEAIRQVSVIQENIRQGRQLQQPTVDYVQSKTELQITYMRLQAEVMQAILPIATAISTSLDEYVKPLVLALNAYNGSGAQDFYANFMQLSKFLQMAGNSAALTQEGTKQIINLIYDEIYDERHKNNAVLEDIATFMGADVQDIKQNVNNLPVYTGP